MATNTFVSNATTLPLFNGFSGYSSTGNAWNVTNGDPFTFNETDEINITIAGWLRKTGGSNTFLANIDPTGGFNWDLAWSTGITIRGDDGVVSVVGTGFLVINTPIWFAVIRNDTNTCIVVNGTLDVCGTNFLFGNATGVLVVGGNVVGTNEADIYIDELGFWNMSLSLF